VSVHPEDVLDRLLEQQGVVFLLGGIETGKTTFGIDLVRRATEAGIPAAIVDGDVAQSTVGPPSTVGLKLCAGMSEFTLETLRGADALSFVGSISPRGHLVPLVAGTAKLVARAKEAGCRLVVVDTTGVVSGITGQVLKYHKMDLISPDFVLAFERGEELEPIVGIAQRFTPAEVVEVEVSGDVVPRSIEDRMTFREHQFAAYFASGTSRWRVRPTVFMPTLPPDFDPGVLDGLVVGMEDGKGTCAGIGVLEYDGREDILRMVSPVTEGVRGLRLGSIRIDIEGRSKGPVDLRELFKSE
jgi:polynucleotide 5'-hydroxyl-kinase GRC3/NOL9